LARRIIESFIVGQTYFILSLILDKNFLDCWNCVL